MLERATLSGVRSKYGFSSITPVTTLPSMILGRRLSPLQLLSVVCALLPSIAWADKVYLKSGEVITGTILEETPDNVRIQVLVGTIKDKRSISRVSIDRIEKTTPEDVERDACLPLKVTPDGLPAKGYEERLKVVDEFLAKYPASKYLTEIQGIRDSLNAELDRIKKGESRFRGNWLTPDQQTIHRIKSRGQHRPSDHEASDRREKPPGSSPSIRVY